MFFNDGATQYWKATTICTGASGGEYTSDRAHFGFVYRQAHHAISLLPRPPNALFALLLQGLDNHTTLPPSLARQQMTAAVRTFVASVDLDGPSPRTVTIEHLGILKFS